MLVRYLVDFPAQKSNKKFRRIMLMDKNKIKIKFTDFGHT